METLSLGLTKNKEDLHRRANALALVTIFYNFLEGLVSVYLGAEDETMALFGFGVDSFVEVISGVGIWHMVRRLRQNRDGRPDRFERRALKITGTAFYILTAGLSNRARGCCWDRDAAFRNFSAMLRFRVTSSAR